MNLISISKSAWAQSHEPGFFEKYLNIAKLFDSPVFFGIVVGSGVILLIASLLFLWYMKHWEKKVDEWGENKSTDEMIEYLQLFGLHDGKMAFAYLRKHGDENLIPKLIEELKAQRKKGQMSPYVFYLLEDLIAVEALPILQQIANGKSRVSGLAQNAVEYIENATSNEKSEKKDNQAEAKA